MSKIGKCCCNDCCLDEGEMPYTSVTLKSPYYACEGSGSPVYPTENFVKLTCCYQAAFNFETNGQCPPETFNCFLWAKRTLNFSYQVQYYRAEVSYTNSDPRIEDPPPSLECPCTLVQTKDVDYEGVSRAFLLQSYRLQKITISVGKTFIQCDGDESPVCKYYIATTWDFVVSEDIPFPVHYSKATLSCTGNFQDENCSITNSWIEESGTNSDACPFDEFEVNPVSTVVSISRIKFYDTLPAPGEITISDADDEPFSCCGGKTGCEITTTGCGILIGTNCIPAAPTYDEFLNDNPLYTLVPCGTGGEAGSGAIFWDEETQAWLCVQVCENGYMEADVRSSQVYWRPADASYCWELVATCSVQSVGWDKFISPLVECGPRTSNTELEGVSPCGTLDVDYVNDVYPNPPAVPYCLGGATPPEPGLCLNGDCCFYEEFGFQIEFPCTDLHGYCGRKIVDFTCDHVRTDYVVGGTCIPIPTAIFEVA